MEGDSNMTQDMMQNMKPEEKKFEDMTREEKREFFRQKEERRIESDVNKLEIERTATQICERQNGIIYVNPDTLKSKYEQIEGKFARRFSEEYVLEICNNWDKKNENEKIYYRVDQKVKMAGALFLYVYELAHDEELSKIVKKRKKKR